MLNRKYCAKNKNTLEDLLYIGDFNVRVTKVDKKNVTSDCSWKEVFRDSIGGGIINDTTNMYYFDIMTGSGACIQSSAVGHELISEIFDFIKNEDLVRINLIKLPSKNNNPRSWIVIRK